MVLVIMNTLIVLTGGVFSFFFFRDYSKNRNEIPTSNKRYAAHFGIGFVVNFFDTLGIGSFAPTMSIYKLFKLVPDKLIPGTLNVGCYLPVAVMAIIFMRIINVDTLTLVLMVVASVIGAVVGVGVLKNLPVQRVRVTMGCGLLLAATLMFLGQVGLFPVGGEDIGLTGGRLVIAVVGNFILGMLLPLGVGNYAPCMAMVYLLGLNPAVAFPVMMSSATFVLSTSGTRFAQEGIYDRKAAMGLGIGGIPAVFIAAFIVGSLPLDLLRWLVICVVVYTSITMLIGALKKDKPEAAAA